MKENVGFLRVWLVTMLLVAVSSMWCAEGNAEGLKIGVSAPLTGPLAEYGRAVQRGFEMAQSGSSGPKGRATILLEDNQYDASRAVSIFRKLTEIDHVDIIYNWGELPLSAVAPLTQEKKTLVLAMSVDAAPAINQPYVIRTINHPSEYAALTLSFLRKKGARRFAILKAEDPFTNALSQSFVSQLNAHETLGSSLSFDPSDMDFRSAIVRLKSQAYDAVGVYLLPGQVGAFYRQLKELDYKVLSFGSDCFESSQEISIAQGGMEGAFYPNIKVPSEFRGEYERRYADALQVSFAYNAYVIAKMLLSLDRSPFAPMRSGFSIARGLARAGFQIDETESGDLYLKFPMELKIVREGLFIPLQDTGRSVS